MNRRTELIRRTTSSHLQHAAARLCLSLKALVILPWALAAAEPVLVIEDAAQPTVTLSRDTLLGMPRSSFMTSTVWTSGVHTYEGVALHTLLYLLGVRPDAALDGSVRITALDGYTAELAFRDLTPEAPMLAILRNGDFMPTRQQGPFWLLFPFDDVPEYRTDRTYGQSVWQVERLQIIR